jgi:hypothetical protein
LSAELLLPLVPIAIVAVAVAAIYPRFAVWATLFLVFFGDRSEIPFLAFWGRYIATAGVLLLVTGYAIRKTIQMRVDVRLPLFAVLPFAAFALHVLFSALLNGSSGKSLALSLMTNLRYPLFFFVLVDLDLPPSFYARLFRAFIAFGVLQIPVAVVQYALGYEGDTIHGTFGSNSRLVEILLFTECMLLARLPYGRAGRFIRMTLMPLLLLPAILGDSEVMFIFFPVLLIVMFGRHYGFRRAFRALGWSALIFVAGAGIVLFVIRNSSRISQLEISANHHVSNLRNWSEPWVASYASVGRLTIIPLSWPLLAEKPYRILMGFGPEAALGGAIGGENRTNADEGVVCQALFAKGILCRESQSFKSLMEFGIVGIVLYFLPATILWWHGRRFAHSRDRNKKVLWLQYEGILLLYFLSFWYSSVWRIDTFGFAFWVTAASVTSILIPSAAPVRRRALPLLENTDPCVA